MFLTGIRHTIPFITPSKSSLHRLYYQSLGDGSKQTLRKHSSFDKPPETKPDLSNRLHVCDELLLLWPWAAAAIKLAPRPPEEVQKVLSRYIQGKTFITDKHSSALLQLQTDTTVQRPGAVLFSRSAFWLQTQQTTSRSSVTHRLVQGDRKFQFHSFQVPILLLRCLRMDEFKNMVI